MHTTFITPKTRLELTFILQSTNRLGFANGQNEWLNDPNNTSTLLWDLQIVGLYQRNNFREAKMGLDFSWLWPRTMGEWRLSKSCYFSLSVEVGNEKDDLVFFFFKYPQISPFVYGPHMCWTN